MKGECDTRNGEVKMNEYEKTCEVKKSEPKFKPSYNPEEDVDGKMKKFTIQKHREYS